MSVKIYTMADDGKFSKVLRFSNGRTIEIPIYKNGSVRWFDDSKLMKKDTEQAK